MTFRFFCNKFKKSKKYKKIKKIKKIKKMIFFKAYNIGLHHVAEGPYNFVYTRTAVYQTVYRKEWFSKRRAQVNLGGYESGHGVLRNAVHRKTRA
jgi:hypothetical protein